MLPAVSNYLEEVRSHLYLRTEVEKQLLDELESHLQEKMADLIKRGLPENEAADKAIESFGQPEKVAQLLYEACCQGSWTDAIKISLPHFLVAAIFTSSLLNRLEIALPVFSIILLITLSGWWRGKPDWLYSWIGYAMMPLFAGILLLLPVVHQLFAAIFGGSAMPAAGLLVGVVVFYISALWLVVWVSIRAVRRDWLLASLMLVPVPIIGCWLFHLQQAGGFFGDAGLLYLDQPIAQALMVLGITSILFLRLRQRLLKAGAIITVSAISMMGVGQSLWGDIGFFGLLGLSLFSLLFFIVPAIADAAIGHGEPLPDNR